MRPQCRLVTTGLTPVLPTAEATQCFVVVASASLKECQFLIFPNPSFLNRSFVDKAAKTHSVDTRDNIMWWTIPGRILEILAHLKTQQQSKRKDSLGVWRGRGWDPKSHSQSHAAWSEQKSLEGSALVFNTLWHNDRAALSNFFTGILFWLTCLFDWHICGIFGIFVRFCGICCFRDNIIHLVVPPPVTHYVSLQWLSKEYPYFFDIS